MRWIAAALCLLPLLSAAEVVGPLDAADALLVGSPVVYDESADPATFDFASIVSGIERSADVEFYPMAWSSSAVEVAGAAPAGRPARGPDESTIAVVYPDIGEPYRSVFARIIEGIEEKAKGRTARYPIGANQDPEAMADELRRAGTRMVIALGRNGLKAATRLDREVGVVVGCVVSAPDADTRGMSVHSLAPDPMLLFDRLRAMMPGVRRVFIVYDPRQNAWLLRLAREAARYHGLELVAQEASDLRTAMHLYHDLVAGADPRRDALWLPQDSVTVEESAVLPAVLQEAWNRGLAVFSSSVAHVRRGALFSLYPNNVDLGRSLAGAAMGQMAGNAAPARGVVPLRDVHMAVNVRTAGHLGLGAAQRQLSFDMVFPEQ